MLYAPGEVREDSVLLDAVSAEVQVVDGRRRLLGLFQRHPAAPVSPSLPLWMQVVSAVVTWLGAISVILAVLTFRLSGPWIRLRGEVDAENQIRLIATNHGRIAGCTRRSTASSARTDHPRQGRGLLLEGGAGLWTAGWNRRGRMADSPDCASQVPHP